PSYFTTQLSLHDALPILREGGDTRGGCDTPGGGDTRGGGEMRAGGGRSRYCQAGAASYVRRSFHRRSGGGTNRSRGGVRYSTPRRCAGSCRQITGRGVPGRVTITLWTRVLSMTTWRSRQTGRGSCQSLGRSGTYGPHAKPTV